MGLQIRRVTQTKLKLLFASLAIMAVAVQPLYGFVAGKVANAASSKTINSAAYYGNPGKPSVDCDRDATSSIACNTISSAIAIAKAGDTIKLRGNFNIHKEIVVDKAVTIEGQSYTGTPVIKAKFNTNGSNNSLFELRAPAKITNVHLDGMGNYIHGINAWHTNGDATVWKAQLANFGKSGLVVGEQARVVASDLITKGNAWSAINVDKPGAWLKLAGSNSFNENKSVPAVYFDKWSPSKVQFDNEYRLDHVNKYAKTGDRAFFPSANPIKIGDVVINGQDVNSSDIRTANLDPVSDKVYFVGNTLNLSAVIGTQSIGNPEMQSSTPVAKVSYKVRKLSNSGGTQTGIYQSKSVNMVGTSGAEWTTPEGDRIDLSTDKDGITNGVVDGSTYTVQITVRDSAGNEATKFVDFTADLSAPNIGWQKQPIEIYGMGQGFHVRPITSEVGTTKSVYVDSVDPANLVWSLTGSGKNFDTKNGNNQALWDSLSDGVHNFIATFKDYAGNITTSFSNSFVVDRKMPTISITSPSEGAFNPSEYKVSAHDENGLKEVTVIVRDKSGNEKLSTNCEKVTVVTGDDFNATCQLPSNLADGEYTIRYNAKDFAGNQTTSDTVNFTVDTAFPSTPVITPSDNSDIKGIQKFTITSDEAIEATSNIGTLVDNGDDTWSLDTTELDRDTVVEITATARDAADNTSTSTAKFTVKNDAPTMTVKESTSAATTTLSGTVNPATDKTTVTVHFNGSDYLAAVDTVNGTWSVTISVANLSSGNYDYAVIANDGYNNIHTYTDSLTVPRVANRFVSPLSTQRGVLPVASPTTPGQTAGNTIATQPPTFNPTTQDEDTLGASTADSGVKGAADDKSSTASFFGLAWYWWILILAALLAAIWWIAAAARKKQEA